MTTAATTSATPTPTAEAKAEATADDVPMAAASASSSDSDSDDDDTRLPWLLGFVEPPASSLSLLRHHFRSKVGGRPAWLDPCRLPKPSQLCCGVTGAPLDFLCQVYAPLDESESESDDDDGIEKTKNDHADAFHRAVFVFVGPSGSALADGNSLATGNRSVRAFRCQLPRENLHYSPVPAPGGDGVGCPPPRLVDPSTVTNEDRWRVAECEASIVAAAAEAAASVSGGGAGGGAQVAAAEAEAAACAAASAFASSSGGGGGKVPAAARLFPEAELVVEEEGSDCGSDLDEAIERANRAAGAAAPPKTPARKVEDDGGERDDDGEEEDQADAEMMDSIEASVHPDAAAMARFSARVARAPSQALRYRFDRRRRKGKKSSNGSIWPRALPRPPSDADVPPCPNCGSPRALEFQLLPQMLNFLGCDADDESAPDWSCVGVWSCVESCSASSREPTSDAGAPSTPLSKTGGAGISGGPSAYLEEFVWVQPSDAQQEQRR